LEIPTPPNLSRQPHTPAILSELDLDLALALDLDLDRGGDVGWMARYPARRRTMDMGLDDRPELPPSGRGDHRVAA
jgi:hypothetical protein